MKLHNTYLARLICSLLLAFSLCSLSLKSSVLPLNTKGVLELSALCKFKKITGALQVEQLWKTLLLEGKPVLARFVTHNCPLCSSSTPLFKKIAERQASKLICINISYEEFTPLSKQYAITKAPTYILFNKGTIVWRYQGAINENTLNTYINPHIPA